MKAVFLRIPAVVLAGFLLGAGPVLALQTDAVEPVAGFEPSRVTVSLNGFISSYLKVDNINYWGVNDNFYGLGAQINLMISPSPYWAFYGRVNANALDRREHTIDRLNPHYGDDLAYSPQFEAWVGQAYLKFNLSGHEFRLGRIGTEYDAWGLAGLGWAPATAFTRVAPFDNGYTHDGVHWNYDFGNGLSLHALIGRAVTTEYTREYDQDNRWDELKWYEGRYVVAQIEGRKLWPTGGASLGLRYDRDATAQWLSGQDLNVLRSISLNPAFRQSFGKFSVQAEARLSWATLRSYEELKETAFGAFANLGYDLGKGSLNLSGWYFSGHKIGARSFPLIKSGFHFYPLLIAYNPGAGPHFLNDLEDGISIVEAANSDFDLNWAFLDVPDGYEAYALHDKAQFANNEQNNHWAIALGGDYQILDNLTVHATLAYLRLVNSTYLAPDQAIMDDKLTWDQVSYVTQSKSLGIELNLGLSYDLLPCLNLSTIAGYFWAGDALRPLQGFRLDAQNSTPTEGDTASAVWGKPENRFAWYSSLTWYF